VDSLVLLPAGFFFSEECVGLGSATFFFPAKIRRLALFGIRKDGVFFLFFLFFFFPFLQLAMRENSSSPSTDYDPPSLQRTCQDSLFPFSMQWYEFPLPPLLPLHFRTESLFLPLPRVFSLTQLPRRAGSRSLSPLDMRKYGFFPFFGDARRGHPILP